VRAKLAVEPSSRRAVELSSCHWVATPSPEARHHLSMDRCDTPKMATTSTKQSSSPHVSCLPVVLIFVSALLLTLLWLAGAFFFMLEAWGLRGMDKPWWIGLGSAGALLGWLVPFGMCVFGAVQWSRRRAYRHRDSACPAWPFPE